MIIGDQTFVVLVAIPLAVVKNGIRIFTLAVLGTYVDPTFLTGRLQHNGGILFFLLALAVIFGVLRILQRAEARRDAPVIPAAQRV